MKGTTIGMNGTSETENRLSDERRERLAELERRMGYSFRDPRYLHRATIHSSFSNETGERNHHLLCNERLEFLGDSVLSVVASDYLYDRFPNCPEGDLTRLRSAIVCEGALASYARKIGLGEFLLLGKGESNNGGADKSAILADAFEATLAAVYLDAGGADGIGRVTEFLLPYLREEVDTLAQPEHGVQADHKSRLQEFVQKNQETLEYREVSESGPDHDKTFCVEVYLNSNRIGRGVGHSKKRAEQEAAKDALRLFGLTD